MLFDMFLTGFDIRLAHFGGEAAGGGGGRRG